MGFPGPLCLVVGIEALPETAEPCTGLVLPLLARELHVDGLGVHLRLHGPHQLGERSPVGLGQIPVATHDDR